MPDSDAFAFFIFYSTIPSFASKIFYKLIRLLTTESVGIVEVEIVEVTKVSNQIESDMLTNVEEL